MKATAMAMLSLLTSLATSCATAPVEPQDNVPYASERDVAAASDTDVTSEDGTRPARMKRTDTLEKPPRSRVANLSPVALAMWNDPVFERRFTESYLAETDVEPELTLDERENLEKVFDMMAADKMGKAEKLLEKYRGPAATAVFDYWLANILFQQDRLDEAVAALGVALDKCSRYRRAYHTLGMIHFQEGRFDAALRMLTKVIELGGGNAITYGMLGIAYSNVGDDLPAESAFRMALLLDPATGEWNMGLAHSLFKQRRYADAVALWDAMIEKEPQRAELWTRQASGYIGLGKPLMAAENYEVADRLGGSTVETLSNLADIYLNEKLFELAVAAYIRSMQAGDEARPDRSFAAAGVLMAYGALEEAETLSESIEALFGDSLTDDQKRGLLKMRSRFALAAGDDAEEAKVLEETIALDPLDGEAIMMLGQYHSRTGDDERAAFLYRRAAAIEAFEADAKLRHAQLLVKQERYVEAVPMLQRSHDLSQRDDVAEFLRKVERAAQGRSR